MKGELHAAAEAVYGKIFDSSLPREETCLLCRYCEWR